MEYLYRTHQPLRSAFQDTALQLAGQWLASPTIAPRHVDDPLLRDRLTRQDNRIYGWFEHNGQRVHAKSVFANFAANEKWASDLGTQAGLPVASVTLVDADPAARNFWVLSAEPFAKSRGLADLIMATPEAQWSVIRRNPIFPIISVFYTATAQHDLRPHNVVFNSEPLADSKACIIDHGQAKFEKIPPTRDFIHLQAEAALAQIDGMRTAVDRLQKIPPEIARDIFMRMPEHIIATPARQSAYDAYRHNLEHTATHLAKLA